MSSEGEDEGSGDGLRIHAGLEEGDAVSKGNSQRFKLESSKIDGDEGDTHLETVGESDEGEVGDNS